MESLDIEFLKDASDQDSVLEPSTPDTPFTPASPRKAKRSRENYLDCPYLGCDKSFNRPARLEEHIRSHKNDRIFKCPHEGCTKDFLRQTHLKRHIEANHIEGQKNYVCQYEGCGQSFVTNQRLNRHHAVHEKRDRYTCAEPGCGMTFRKHNTLDQHRRVAHLGQSAFPCDEILEDGTICPKGFGNAHYLKLHKGRDHGATSYFCTLCPEGPESAFGTYSDLQAHNKAVHPPTCETCGYKAKTPKEVLLHIQNKHSGDTLASRQTHICPFPECGGKGFVEKKNLKLHILSIHEGKKPFTCGDLSLSLNHVADWDVSTACGRSFSHKANLENHIRTNHQGLDSMQKQRLAKKRKPAVNGEEEDLYTESQPAKKKSKRQKAPSGLDLLTGTSMSMDPRRTIPCPVLGCEYVFMREWDKIVHLHARHGIEIEDEWIMMTSQNDDDDDYNSKNQQSKTSYTETRHPNYTNNNHHTQSSHKSRNKYNNDEGNDDEDDRYEATTTTTIPTSHLTPFVPEEISAMAYTSAEEALEASALADGRFWLGGIDPESKYGNDDDEYADADEGNFVYDPVWNGFGDGFGGDDDDDDEDN